MSKNFIFILIFILFLGGCVGETYEFKGKSDNWRMNYNVQTTGNDEDAEINIVYIGKDEPPTEINYYIKNPNTEMNGQVPYKSGGISWSDNICSDCHPLRKNVEINVEISWEDKTEKLTLKHNN